jgi:tetratricopeptide (TPR) repeat protein
MFRCRPTHASALFALLTLSSQTFSLSAPAQAHAGKLFSSTSRGTSSNSGILVRAKKLIQEGDPQGALSILEQADPKGPNASDIHTIKGVCLALLAKPVESAAEFDQAIAMRPNYAPTYLSAGLAAANFDNLDLALDRLSSALRMDPNLPGARYNYALVLARAGKFAASEKEVDEELENKGVKSEAALDLWRLKARDAYYQKKWQETIQAYRKTAEFEPDFPEAYAAIGEALFSLNRAEESVAVLEKAAALDPENGATHALLGKLYQDAGKQEQAIVQFEAAHRLRPNDQEVIYRLYRIYSHNGDSADASRLKRDLESLIASRNAQSLSEATATALNNKGVELEKEGDLSGALDDFDQAAKADVTNIIFQRNAALILCRLGRTEEAKRRLTDILSLDPDDAETLQILAVANETATGNSVYKTALPAAKPDH